MTVSRYGRYCRAHATNLRRNGGINQPAVTKAMLAPYLKLVAARREKNPGAALWDLLDAAWEKLAESAAAANRSFCAGKTTITYQLRAADDIARLAQEDRREVIDTALAMFMMWELEPRRFGSDQGFQTQLVRRVRGVGDVNVGGGWNNAEGKFKRRYKDLPPRTAAILADWLTKAFGAGGLRLAALEVRDIEARQASAQTLRSALEEIQ
ncbi:hypothetical protein [Aureimonas psammosilenae]|uniref:hypothetical protein n=1 Tax=Aureimonas psammosilenae TaxID=2495496 RepID=UPI001260AA92|nr:hypothetical protein [Aureimonas psammosilenae]